MAFLKQLLKYLITRTYRPVLVKYLSKTRTYVYKNITLVIPREVFHPGFFFSTRLLLRYVSFQHLNQKTLLELGAGSGLISIYAARKGSRVTASDINPVAIAFLEKNSQCNGVHFRILHSDLFDQIPLQAYDVMVINPPYYKKKPVSYADYAWFCGENGEYFERLFRGLKDYMHENSVVLMVLCEGCDLEMVHGFAQENGFRLDCLYQKQNILEKNFIFKIKFA
jgi:release factor glutamine methyltransferase